MRLPAVLCLAQTGRASRCRRRPKRDILDEPARREERPAAIEKTKAEIKCRARERFDAEQAEYEENLKRRKGRKMKTGGKAHGRSPRPASTGPREKDQVDFTGEGSCVMPSSEGFVRAYNRPAAVDIDTHLIVENHLSRQPHDKQEIKPARKRLHKVEDSLGKLGLLADGDYFSADNVKCGQVEGATPAILNRRQRHNRLLKERVEQPPSCPTDAAVLTATQRRLRTPAGKAIYVGCKSTVGTVFGILKEVMGFRRFHFRGLDAAQDEWNSVCMAQNPK